MTGQYSNDQMLDMYIYETSQNLEQLEAVILACEHSGCYSPESINDIFRMMHTIKGSSAMMLLDNIANLAHHMEDLFQFLREQQHIELDSSALSDLVLHGVDFIKLELQKVKAGDEVDGDCSNLARDIEQLLAQLKQQTSSESDSTGPMAPGTDQHYYITPAKTVSVSPGKPFKAILHFEENCQMEHIRAYAVVHALREMTDEVVFFPADILDSDESAEVIKQQGFTVYTKLDKSYQEFQQYLMTTPFLRVLELTQLADDSELQQFVKPATRKVEESAIKVPRIQRAEVEAAATTISLNQNLISVNVSKLDKLMDLVGEMVIAEAMVTQNPDLRGLNLDNFAKAARQLHKITSELQDTVMSIRMVPLAATFHKMHRILRDMAKKLDKEVQLELAGEETEVDKNIIEHISDPLMHLIRNAIDHGIEPAEVRVSAGKSRFGTVYLEAKNAGSDVVVTVRDNGRGLDKEKILRRAQENGLLHRPAEALTDREIYNLIFLPGFSTKDAVSEFSGRGVGMDVVTKNLATVGGLVSVDSQEGHGSTIYLKIPLTLAIIDGMNVKVGNASYTIPTISIKESFRPRETDLVVDPDGNEMVMVRGECHPIIRLHQRFGVKTVISDLTAGILIMVEQDEKTLCLFADQLIGQQQVVVKPLPGYIKDIKQIGGLAGCTILGDGGISLILDVSGLMA